MPNAFLIIYLPHQQLTSQGKAVYSKWAKEEGGRQIAFKRSRWGMMAVKTYGLAKLDPSFGGKKQNLEEKSAELLH